MSVVKKFTIFILLLQFTYASTIASIQVKVCNKNKCITKIVLKSVLDSINDNEHICHSNTDKSDCFIKNTTVNNPNLFSLDCCKNINSLNQPRENCCKFNNIFLKLSFVSSSIPNFKLSPKIVLKKEFSFFNTNYFFESIVKSIKYNSKHFLISSNINLEIISFLV